MKRFIQTSPDRDLLYQISTFSHSLDLIANGSRGLTGELKAQTDAILVNANARAAATSTQLSARFRDDMTYARGALGRTSDEEAVYRQAMRYATPGTEGFDRISTELREIQTLTQARDLTGGALKGLASDLMHGTSAATALSNALSRVQDTLMNRLIDQAVNPLFGAAGGGSGGLLGSIASWLTGGTNAAGALGAGGDFNMGAVLRDTQWLADGGVVSGPGGPREDRVLARLSAGEFVVNAAATSAHRPLLDAINEGRLRPLPGYAAGGYIGPGDFTRPSPQPFPAVAGNRDGGLSVNITNNTGAQVAAQEVPDGRGGRRIEVTVDETMAQAVGRPGSLTAAALSRPRVASR